MKIKDLTRAFQGITHVYDSIEDFQRKLNIVPAYNEIKGHINFYEEERGKLIEKATKDNKITPDEGAQIEIKISNLLNADAKLKKPLKFTLKEAGDSKIRGSWLATLVELEFIIMEGKEKQDA